MRYNDRLIRLISIPLIVFFMVHLGRQGTLIDFLQNKDNYYFDLLFSLALTTSIWQTTRFVIVRLDNRLPWSKSPFQRAFYQLAVTLIAAAVLMYLLSFIYASLLDIPVEYILSPTVELPVGLLFTVVVNMLYLILYLFNKQRFKSEENEPTLIGLSGTRKLPVKSSDVAYFYSKSKIVYAVLANNDTLRTGYTLDELEKKTNGFFRVNRQFLANKNAVESYKPIENRKLELSLKPSYSQIVVVSQKKASLFKSWIEAA